MRLVSAASLLAIVGALPALLPLACRSSEVSAIGLVMSAPQGVLDEATSLSLSVFSADGSSCSADGSVGEVPGDAQSFSLSKEGCSGGATWCGEITLEQDDAEKMFFVQAKSSAGVLAQGCAKATIDRDPLDVAIKVVRVVEESCCGDGILQTGELCDEGGSTTCGGSTESFKCGADCLTKPLQLDDFGEDNGQGSLALTFAGGDAQLDGGLRAAFNYPGVSQDIGLRILQADLSPVTDPAVLSGPVRLYLRCNGMTQLATRNQSNSSLAPLASGAVVAFMSNEASNLRVDASVVIVDEDGCSEGSALVASDGLTSVQDVAIAAGPAGQALVVWEQGGQVLARKFDGTAFEAQLVIAGAGSSPSVSGGASGWAVAYAGAGTGDADGIFLSRVSSAGDVADAVLVNAKTADVQDQPAVAMLTDGSLGVAFRSGDDILFQRYDASGGALTDDQASPIHGDSSGSQGAPVVAAGPSGGFYVVAWESGTDVRARFAGKDSSFLFNALTGQNGDFSVVAGAVAPKGPAIAVKDQVVFGWTDLSASVPGIFVRAFPLPE